MASRLSRLTLNQRLAAIAFALGAVALFSDVARGRTLRVNEKELLVSAARGAEQVAPADLARWIVEGRADYRLIDLREPARYAEYHVPTAENVPVAGLAEASIARTETVVLYGESPTVAAQAWIVLKGAGYRSASVLAGGLEGWKDDVLFPAAPSDPRRQAAFERAAQLARFFGGQPRTATARGGAPATLPQAAPVPPVAAPTLPSGAGATGPKKKKEGC